MIVGARIINVAPDDRVGPIWEIVTLHGPDRKEHRESSGKHTSPDRAKLEALCAREGWELEG